VLLVDDHPGFRRAAHRMLAAEGFLVVGESADGASVVERVRALRPELVLLDVLLPDLDGFAVAELLAREPSPPCVVLTSSRDAGDYATRLRVSPAVAFVAKAELSGARLTALLEMTS
jgi:DNA-binding NarL/FixJ family response regulator